MGRILLLSVLALSLTLGLFSCEREGDKTSLVSLKLPTYSDVSSLSCTKCLKAVVVNIDGAGFPTLKFFNKMDFELASAQLSSEVVFDVPSGPERKIQILAIYRLNDGTFEAQYGSVVRDIFAIEPPPIVLALNNLGPFKAGSIVGRYLTSADNGPTGKVIISMNHAASGLSMDIFDAQILNGWFEFFMSENFSMSYRLANGTALGVPLLGLQNKSLDSLVPITGAIVTPHMARVHRPSTYFRSTNGGWSTDVESVNEFHDIIYGYFGDVGSVATKLVCLDDAASTVLSRMSSTGASADITYNYNNTVVPNSVYTVGGMSVTAGGLSCSGDNTSNSNDRILVNRAQFNGMGNDTAKAIGGAFTYYFDTGEVKKYLKSVSINTAFLFKALPNMFALPGVNPATPFDGAKLFIKPNSAIGGYEHAICTAEWLSLNGFNEFTDFATPLTVSATAVSFSINTTSLSGLNAPPVNSGFILCPTKLGAMTGYGGIYAGGLQ
ncbi:MAG: hypothetical protein AABY53_05960 [Bdellovibrionota bacterium]